MATLDPNAIPGMIEPVERRLLYRLGSELPFEDGECGVEFGAFFGRSTAFLSLGLGARSGGSPPLFVYDSFGCDTGGSFRPHVLSFAEAGGVRHLVQESHGRVDFFPVFSFYLKSMIESGAVVATRSELADSRPPIQPIRLMHIDSPKLYVDFKPILFRFFPRLKLGAAIVFQDFFYHWSATLIAAVGALLRFGFLEFRETAATSLVCTLVRELDEKAAAEVDLAMSSDINLLAFMDYAIEACSRMSVDRPETFLARLQLAKLQWFMERGDGARAAEVVTRFFQSGGSLNQTVFSDFIELMSNSFSMEKLYRLDHKGVESGG